jgi:quinoprotein glucose dehydrogenase
MTRFNPGQPNASVAAWLAACMVACAPGDAGPRPKAGDWTTTGADHGYTRYSPLDQINRDNVARLDVAWTYRTGDAPSGGRSQIQATPIIVDGVLYTTTPALAVVALRADSGTLIWRFDPFANRERESHVNRGVARWADGRDARIFFTAGRRLYALDATSGRPIPSFGDSGWVDLAAGLGRDIGDALIGATTPGVVYKDLLIQGTRVGEEEGSAPGHVRAYDVRTGAIRWTFHTIPRPGEVGHDTWPPDAWKSAGGANSWAGMSVDTERGIVYVPTGSVTPDFYGGARPGANLFANTLLALDATSGRRLWHFQTVHHDVWDRDLPAAPNLVTVTRNGTRVDAVAQITKSAFVFVFDRVSGKSLFPIEERPVPASDLAGEQTSPTQPFPLAPEPFARQTITEADLADLSPNARAAALRRFRTLRWKGLYTPPSREGSIVLPGFDGGGEWGGAAVDPETGIMYVNASDVPWIAAMREAKGATPPYEFAGYERWRDSSGFPTIKPPWGTLTAIDLNTGEHRWRITLGEHASLTARGTPATGTELYGGPIVTAGGLVFIAATQDGQFRAFDKATGKLLWETALPAPGYATPATYSVRGKQYVIIAAGGGKLGSPSSDAYVAFALPD